MNTPEVSIIITCYNYGEYVLQAIKSALNQTYKDLEVIVVNDGSTDDTSLIIEPYLKKIIYIEQKNSGVVVARNIGAAQSTGRYLVFLDADDYLSTDFIERSLKAFDNTPEAGFVYGDRQVFGVRSYNLASRDWDPYMLRVINYIGLSSLIRREVFEKVGGFSVSLNKKKSYEDWGFWLGALQAGISGYYDPSVIYHYRRNDEGNRNQANVWQKLTLRLPVMLLYWRLYLSPRFLIRLPALSVKALKNKRRVLASN